MYNYKSNFPCKAKEKLLKILEEIRCDKLFTSLRNIQKMQNCVNMLIMNYKVNSHYSQSV